MVKKLDNSGRKYTYQDYKTWPDDERWEIIDGEAYNMTPAHKDITVLLLQEDGKYSEPKTYPTDEKVTPSLFPDLLIDQELVYRDI
ncbi:hypothetical protein [Lutispora sp.]|uniref:hypothetical protein n=1 Tax=Lutispora sp. TaxID=2828727 RepID=UPI002B1F205C|nr:hypothetical protein [Lutispora sp.]MEA4964057.1 hypothetical protein [Lutispora sp.]